MAHEADEIKDEQGRPWFESMDARVWAKAFVALDPHAEVGGGISSTEEAMLAWFANAIMRGYDHAMQKLRQAGDAEALMEEARGIAAQCWCDEQTSDIEMDARLAEAFARRLAPLMLESAKGEQVTAATSDGFHTFAELYEHRSALFLYALSQASEDNDAWYTTEHEDGSMFDGYFLAGMDVRTGYDIWERVTYHLELKYMDAVEAMGHVEKLKRAPAFDGHTSADVVARLLQAAAVAG